jgi:hypothetical protein
MDVAKDDKVKAAKLNTNAEEDEFADKRRKEEYEAAKDLFKTTYRQRATEVKENREDEYNAMQKMVEQANKMAGRTPPDFAGARENLNRAIDMAKYIIDNAQDDTSPQGRNLKKLNQSWKSRVSVYLKQVTDLTGKLDGSTPPRDDDDPIDGKAVHKAIDPVLSLFDPRAFDKYVEVLSISKPKPDINEHRKTKEEVLARVRKFQSRLNTNGVLKHLAGNPVSIVALKPLRETLSGLEAEVLGS